MVYKRTSSQQYHQLMEECVRRGVYPPPRIPLTKQQLEDIWTEIAKNVNALGPPTRPALQWKRVFYDFVRINNRSGKNPSDRWCGLNMKYLRRDGKKNQRVIIFDDDDEDDDVELNEVALNNANDLAQNSKSIKTDGETITADNTNEIICGEVVSADTLLDPVVKNEPIDEIDNTPTHVKLISSNNMPNRLPALAVPLTITHYQLPEKSSERSDSAINTKRSANTTPYTTESQLNCHRRKATAANYIISRPKIINSSSLSKHLHHHRNNNNGNVRNRSSSKQQQQQQQQQLNNNYFKQPATPSAAGPSAINKPNDILIATTKIQENINNLSNQFNNQTMVLENLSKISTLMSTLLERQLLALDHQTEAIQSQTAATQQQTLVLNSLVDLLKAKSIESAADEKKD